MRALIKLLLEYILIFLFFFIFIDVLISNTVLNLKGKSCIKFEETFVELKKNCNGKEKIRPFLPTVSIFTDSNGLRVKNKYKQEIKEDKIFVFGSSFIYGAGLNYEQSVIGILEKEHKNYEFNNYSMPWGSPTFHLYRLKEKILEGEIPKKIILVLSMSDIHNETSIWKDYDNFGKPGSTMTRQEYELIDPKDVADARKEFAKLRRVSNRKSYLERLLQKRERARQRSIERDKQSGQLRLPIDD